MSRKREVLPALALAIAALAVAVHPLMQGLENRLLDSFVKSQASRLAPDPDIVLVDIDEKSLAEMEKEARGVGRWPWPRVVYADLIEGLAAQKPLAIVFDILFVEKDLSRPNDDAAFGESAAQHANTYFPLLRLPPANDAAKGVPLGKLADLLGLLRTKAADPGGVLGMRSARLASP
jgi:adenylate cyclase